MLEHRALSRPQVSIVAEARSLQIIRSASSPLCPCDSLPSAKTTVDNPQPRPSIYGHHIQLPMCP